MKKVIIAAAMLFSSQLFAAEIETETYRYGQSLDVAKVLNISSPERSDCLPGTAVMTYLTSEGQLRKLAYSVISDCTHQN